MPQNHKIVPVPFVVSEKEVLAVSSIDLVPVGQCLLHGRDRGVLMNFIFDTQVIQYFKNLLSLFMASLLGTYKVG